MMVARRGRSLRCPWGLPGREWVDMFVTEVRQEQCGCVWLGFNGTVDMRKENKQS